MKKIAIFILFIVLVFPTGLCANATAAPYEWDLTQLFATDEAYRNECTFIEENITKLKAFKGTLKDETKQNEFIALYYTVSDQVAKVYCYGQLLGSKDMTDPSAIEKKDRGLRLKSDFDAATSFVYEELIDPAEMKLSPEAQRTISTLSPALDFYGIYSTLLTEMQLSHEDFSRNIHTLSAIYGRSVMKGHATAQAFGYLDSKSMFLDQYGITQKAYETALSQTNDNLSILHDKYNLEERSSGATLDYHVEGMYTIDQLRTWITEAMRPLGDEYVRVLQMAFDEHWIDAYPAANKRKETFTLSAPGHPYVLLNFTGSVYDSVGLAHELGHAVHMYLSENSSDGNGSNSVLAAEIASGVSELLFAEYMASHAPPKEQLLFAMYLMDLYASRTFTQMMLSEFENMVHSIVDQGGTLTAAGLSAIWLELDEKYRGKSALPEGAQYGWASVAHFYQDFYVCNYTLSFVVADRIASTLSDDSQKERYLYFLSTTSKKPIETAKSIFEIDLEELAPYERLYASFSKRLQTQEQLLLANGLLRKADGGITVNVQGRRIDFAHPAYVEDGATMVDAKEMATALGVELQINPDGIILLHSPSSALIPYVLKDGREYVHIRKLLQSSGYNVDYIPHSNTVMITR